MKSSTLLSISWSLRRAHPERISTWTKLMRPQESDSSTSCRIYRIMPHLTADPFADLFTVPEDAVPGSKYKVKIQRPIIPPDGRWLVYTEDRRLEIQCTPSIVLVRHMSPNLKAYTEVQLASDGRFAVVDDLDFAHWKYSW